MSNFYNGYMVNNNNNYLDGLYASGESVEDAANITAHLHRDDPQLILLVDPGQERLILVRGGKCSGIFYALAKFYDCGGDNGNWK